VSIIPRPCHDTVREDSFGPPVWPARPGAMAHESRTFSLAHLPACFPYLAPALDSDEPGDSPKRRSICVACTARAECFGV
jgi:hypothetical protein